MSDFNKLAEEAAIYQSRLKKIVSDDLVLYNENSLNVMRKILEKHPNGCFDMIFADQTAQFGFAAHSIISI